MYGAVPLRELKRQLPELRAADKLDRVKVIMLTNRTFRRCRVRRRAGQAECLSAIAATPTAATLQVTADAELRVS